MCLFSCCVGTFGELRSETVAISQMGEKRYKHCDFFLYSPIEVVFESLHKPSASIVIVESLF